jgi:hypothetical protein
MNIPIFTRLEEARVDRDSCIVEGIILASGLSENGTFYPPEVVKNAASVFKGVQCYADHPRDGEVERSVRDVVGLIEDVWPDDGRLRATIRLSRSHDWLFTMLAEGLLGDLSINALGRTKVSRRDGRVVREVVEITKAHSVDFVAKGAAGGRVERIIRESAGYEEGLRLLERISLKEIAEARPDLSDQLREQVKAEILIEYEKGTGEIRKYEEEIERRRVALERESIAVRLIESSGLPSEAMLFVLTEALSAHIQPGSDYSKAVEGLIERHRKYLAQLTSEGLIRGMGSEKEIGQDERMKRKQALHLMGVTH